MMFDVWVILGSIFGFGFVTGYIVREVISQRRRAGYRRNIG
jgi:hypothetical protein